VNTRPDVVPFLIAPPFPWVAAADRRIDDGPGEPPADLDAAAALVRAARVGGAFWDLDNDPWTGKGGGEAAAIVAWLLGGPDARAAFARAVSRRWRDPFGGGGATFEDMVALLALWRGQVEASRGIAAAAGMAWWKREAMGRFLWDGRDSPPFVSEVEALRVAGERGQRVAAWPSRVARDYGAGAGVPVTWVEDGFLRSAGLGADCRAPQSVSLDARRPAFDPRGASDLESLLATHPFPADLLARAAALRERLVAARLGKYGSEGEGPGPAWPAGRRVVLAVGQVSDDLSVELGGAGVTGMAEFLRRVRDAEPDAHIVYRPHPDVAAGHRAGRLAKADALRHADAVAEGGLLTPMLDRADAVHVLSSLTGFEALLRGRPVTVHGQPFYAGWGLARDLGPPIARRTRRLSVDQLVAGALILYPRYLDPVTGVPCPVEVLAGRLAATRGVRDTWLTAARRAQGRARRTVAAVRERVRG